MPLLLSIRALGAAALATTLLSPAVLLSPGARADEGMWTMDNLPLKQMKQRYGFTPSADWIQRVTQASARLALGCSAPFVSGDGLVMTNHHCANECLSQLSTSGHDTMENGFTSGGQSKEPRCPAMELDRLDSITDVTKPMNAALAGKQGAGYIAAQRAAESRIETQCVAGDATKWRCDVVSLYHGGRTALYRYRRYQDMRLVFAPQQEIAFFGGDPDNFNFPRYDLDVTFLRAYDQGKPAHTQYFPFNPDGPRAGELVFTSGNPGSTDREATLGELAQLRDQTLPAIRVYDADLDGVLWEYSRIGAMQKQDAADRLFEVENTVKALSGWQLTLADPAVVAAKRKQEDQLRAWIHASKSRRAKFGDPWAKLAPALDAAHRLWLRHAMIEGGERGNPLGLQGELFAYAKTLVRGAAERAKPDAQRLPAFQNAKLPALEAELGSPAPIHPDLEETLLAFSLVKLRQALGVDDPAVSAILGTRSPQELAQHLVSFTHLGDPKVRMALWRGGPAAIDASTDPVIALARRVEPFARQLHQEWDNQVVAPERQASETLARARFARQGTSIYPDATFTQRVSFGTVKGWDENGRQVAPFTHFAGLYKRATGNDPFALQADWLAAKSKLDLATPFDFSSTNDIIGGNSGSPVIDAKGRAVGLIFDGNIHSLGGNFVYDGKLNRAVAIDTAALLAALRVVYGDQMLADELTKGHL